MIFWWVVLGFCLGILTAVVVAAGLSHAAKESIGKFFGWR